MTPDEILDSIFWIQKEIEDGLLVWRDKSGKIGHKTFKAYPSDKIKAVEDFEMMIGRRLAGVVVGYPTKGGPLRFMLRSRTGDTYSLDATPENDPSGAIKDLYDLAAKSAAENKSTSPLVSTN